MAKKLYKVDECATFAGGLVRVRVTAHRNQSHHNLWVSVEMGAVSKVYGLWAGDEAHAVGLGVVPRTTPIGILADWCEEHEPEPCYRDLATAVSRVAVRTALRCLPPGARPDAPAVASRLVGEVSFRQVAAAE